MVENPMAALADVETPPTAAGQQTEAEDGTTTTESPKQADDGAKAVAAALAAQRSVAPLNMHQATVYYCCKAEGAPLGLKIFFMVVTYLLVIFQMAVCLAVQAGIERPSCVDDSQCKTIPRETCSQGQCQGCEGAYRTPNTYFARDESVFNYTHLQLSRGVTDRYPPCMLGYVDPENDIIHGNTQFNPETEEWATERSEYYDSCFLKVDNNITTRWRPCLAGEQDPGSCQTCEGSDRERRAAGDEECELSCDWRTATCLDEVIHVTDPDFVCPHGDTICKRCFDPEERTFYYGSESATTSAVVQAMRLGDWVSLFLVSTIIAASTAAELRDIKLTELSARGSSGGEGCCIPGCGFCGCGSVWHVLMTIAQMSRQFVLLPNLAMLTPALIFNKGGDALGICFNAVAILFLLQIDNQLYEYAMPEEMREEVERKGRLELNASAKRILSWSKLYTFTGLVALTNVAIQFKWNITHGESTLQNNAYLLFCSGIVVERLAADWPALSPVGLGMSVVKMLAMFVYANIVGVILVLVFRYEFHKYNHFLNRSE